jgi:hypothetical protein
MDSEPKIDLSKIYTWKILESLKLEFGTDEYDCVIRLLREFKAETEKEFTARDKRQPTFDEHNSDFRYARRLETMDTSKQKRDIPEIFGQTNEARFDDPEEIKEI